MKDNIPSIYDIRTLLLSSDVIPVELPSKDLTFTATVYGNFMHLQSQEVLLRNVDLQLMYLLSILSSGFQLVK